MFAHGYDWICFLKLCNTVESGKVDIAMNVVERPSGGFSAGGGISSG